MPDETVRNQVGKRYACTVCGSAFIVTKAGSDQRQPLSCHGQTMAPKG
jgi:hypothetical protein